MFFARIKSIAALLFGAMCISCAPKEAAAPFDAVFEIGLGGKSLECQIAVSPYEKARGLMFRESLGKNAAMVFVLGAPQRASFWMKNTQIPLDIAFLDKDGRITEIRKMYPFDLNAVSSASDKICYCIETNQGWFADNKITAGDAIDMDAFLSALKKRKLWNEKGSN